MRAVRERELHSTARSLTRIDPGEGGRSDRMFLNRNLDMNNTTNTDIEDVASDESARDISQQGTRRYLYHHPVSSVSSQGRRAVTPRATEDVCVGLDVLTLLGL